MNIIVVTFRLYHELSIVCLSEWTKPDALTERCQNALPKKVVKEKKLSDKEKKKAAERRK